MRGVLTPEKTERSTAVRPARARRVDAGVACLALVCAGLAVGSAMLWSRILERQEQLETAREALRKRREIEAAVTQNPSDALARVRMGIDLGQRRFLDSAAVQLTTAYALAPDHPLVAYSLGKYYLEVGDHRRAIPPLERATARDPQNAEIRLHLGLAYLNTDDSKAARREFEAAARLNPKLPEVHLGLAMAYSDRSTARRSLEEIDTYIRLAPDPSLGRILLSRAYHLLQDLPRAIAAGRQAVREQPDNPMTWQSLGLALQEGSEAERSEAETCFQRTIQLAPRFADAHIGLARVYLRQKKYAEAAGAFEAALALDPTTGYVQYELGQAYQGGGRKAEAQEQFRGAARYMEYKRKIVAARRAIVLKPGDAELYVRLARLYASREVYDWALPALEKVVQFKPGDAAIRRELRRLQEMARDGV